MRVETIKHQIQSSSVRLLPLDTRRNKVVETLTLEDGSTLTLPDNEVVQHIHTCFNYFWWGCLTPVALAVVVLAPHYLVKLFILYLHL